MTLIYVGVHFKHVLRAFVTMMETNYFPYSTSWLPMLALLSIPLSSKNQNSSTFFGRWYHNENMMWFQVILYTSYTVRSRLRSMWDHHEIKFQTGAGHTLLADWIITWMCRSICIPNKVVGECNTIECKHTGATSNWQDTFTY